MEVSAMPFSTLASASWGSAEGEQLAGVAEGSPGLLVEAVVAGVSVPPGGSISISTEQPVLALAQSIRNRAVPLSMSLKMRKDLIWVSPRGSIKTVCQMPLVV